MHAGHKGTDGPSLVEGPTNKASKILQTKSKSKSISYYFCDVLVTFSLLNASFGFFEGV
jgi:hypothetical protein